MTDEPPANDLLPCPFCGGGSYMISSSIGPLRRWAISCDVCFCRVGEGYTCDGDPSHVFWTKREAIAAWNRRATPAPTANPICPHCSGTGRFYSDPEWQDCVCTEARPTLEQLLAATGPATEADLQAQRESWVRGEMAIGSDADEAREREALRDAEVPASEEDAEQFAITLTCDATVFYEYAADSVALLKRAANTITHLTAELAAANERADINAAAVGLESAEVARLWEAVQNILDMACSRITDGDELGACCWRIGLEDVLEIAISALAGETGVE